MVNTEFYVGWIDNWGLPFQRKNSTVISKALDKLLLMNASVNIYMFEGGSNFGYNNGKLLCLAILFHVCDCSNNKMSVYLLTVYIFTYYF